MSILNTIKSPIIYFAKNSLCMRVGCQRSYPGSGRRAAREKMGGAEKITVLSEPVHDFFYVPVNAGCKNEAECDDKETHIGSAINTMYDYSHLLSVLL